MAPEESNQPQGSSAPIRGNSDKVAIQLDGVAKTLLIPLLARVHDNELPDPILGDPYAKDVLEKITFDSASMTMATIQNGGIAIRTKQFDAWTESFLQKTPNTTVLHLACGFDSRMQRVKWGQNTRWVDVDLPEVIELRRQIQPESIPGKHYSLLGVDVLDENWMHELGDVNGPVLVVMEGLLAYLPEKDARRILQRICERFSGGEILFEGLSTPTLKWMSKSPKEMKAVAETGAVFKSSIDDPKELEDLHSRLELAEFVPVVQAPGVEKLPLSGRMVMYISSWFASGRDSARFFRFKF